MFGDVYICAFPFTSGIGTKVRPVLLLFDLSQDAIICRITSVPQSGPLNVMLRDWQGAGLLKPSTARLDRIVTAEKSIFFRRLGALTSGDLEAVRSAWNQNIQVSANVM